MSLIVIVFISIVILGIVSRIFEFIKNKKEMKALSERLERVEKFIDETTFVILKK